MFKYYVLYPSRLSCFALFDVADERGPLSLVSTIEELLGRKSNCSGLENREYGSRKTMYLFTVSYTKHKYSEDFCLFGYNDMYSFECQPTFRRNMLPPYLGSKDEQGSLSVSRLFLVWLILRL
jgi:hypothetical protein